MKVTFDRDAWDDYLWWQANDRRMVKRINLLIRDIMRGDGDDGIGKPERLRENYAGFSSRRINDEHRLVYRVDADDLVVVQCRFHYRDR